MFIEEDGERLYSLCEVHFDEAGRLSSWTENSDMAPSGSDIDDLTGDLARMLNDAFCWKPIRFSDLHVGIIFEPRISMDQRRAMADYIDEVKDTYKKSPSPITN